jgi:hypothetical protein
VIALGTGGGRAVVSHDLKFGVIADALSRSMTNFGQSPASDRHGVPIPFFREA